MRSMTKHLFFLALALIVAGCGTPGVVTVRNVVDATAAPNQVAQTPTLQSARVGMAEMPGMDGMTTPGVAPTIAAINPVAGATATDFVLAWVLFGTPTPTPSRQDVSATAQGTAISVAVTQVPPTLTPTPKQPTATRQQAAAAAETDVQPGNAANGQMVFTTTGGCSACHDVSNGITVVGPTFKGIASRAGSRKTGMTAADYLHESIVAPNAFVVNGFTQGIMPQYFGQLLTPQQINDVIAYLLTLK